MFEFHGGEEDPAKVERLLCRGRKDLQTLQMLTKWSSETWNFGAPDYWQELRAPYHTGSEKGRSLIGSHF
jgi:hypothetical protein